MSSYHNDNEKPPQMGNLQSGFDAPQMVQVPQFSPGMVTYVGSPVAASPSPMFVPMYSPHMQAQPLLYPHMQAQSPLYPRQNNIPAPTQAWRRQSSTCRKVMQENIENIDLADLAYDEKRNRYLQQRISKLKAEGNLVELRYMFHQLLPEAMQLAVDPYGNFVLQRLLKTVGSELLDVLIQHLKINVNRLARDEYACRILQVILTHGSTTGRVIMLKIMLPEIEELMHDEYGSFVIQKLVETMDPSDLQEVLKAVEPNLYRLCRHRSGTRVVQELFRQLDPSEKAGLTEVLMSEVVDLAMDSVGQYAVMKMIQYGMPEVRKQVAEKLQGNVKQIASTQAGCKVIEKLLLKLRRNDLPVILKSLQEGDTMAELAKCPYGNFVVQQALEAEPRGKTRACVERLFEKRSPHELNRFEKHVYKRMQTFKRK